MWKEEIWGTDLGQENEWKLENLSEDEGRKGEEIKVLLWTGDEVGIKALNWSERQEEFKGEGIRILKCV